MRARQSVLIVEDDAPLREALAAGLAGDYGYSVSTAAELVAADRLINADGARIDAMTLDVTLPDGDGRSFCRKLHHVVPGLILSGWGTS